MPGDDVTIVLIGIGKDGLNDSTPSLISPSKFQVDVVASLQPLVWVSARAEAANSLRASVGPGQKSCVMSESQFDSELAKVFMLRDVCPLGELLEEIEGVSEEPPSPAQLVDLPQS